jgi:hypothetical protein
MRPTLAVTLVLVLSTFGCKKKVDATADAASEAGTIAAEDAGAPDAAVAEEDASAPVASATPSGRVPDPKLGGGGLFGGTYHCLGGLHLAQSGSHVAGNATLGTTSIVTSCSVQGDKCVGTYVSTNTTTKAVIANKSLILTHNKDGSVTFQPGGMPATSCTK